jgi:hypothetical protein
MCNKAATQWINEAGLNYLDLTLCVMDVIHIATSDLNASITAAPSILTWGSFSKWYAFYTGLCGFQSASRIKTAAAKAYGRCILVFQCYPYTDKRKHNRRACLRTLSRYRLRIEIRLTALRAVAFAWMICFYISLLIRKYVVSNNAAVDRWS